MPGQDSPTQQALQQGLLGQPSLPTAGMGTVTAIANWLRQAKEHLQEFDAHAGPDPHPAGVNEGLLERLIKTGGKLAGMLVHEDLPYLEQYLHPDVDILPRTNERPTIGTPANLVHRLPTPGDRAFAKEIANETDQRRAAGGPNTEPQQVVGLGGLGGATLSKGPGYTSVYDTWDFDTNSGLVGPRVPQGVEWLVKQFLQRAGTPFAVYERYPTEPSK